MLVVAQDTKNLNIMGYVDRSEVNGPGRRAVVWLQGCLRAFRAVSIHPLGLKSLIRSSLLSRLWQKYSRIPRMKESRFQGVSPFFRLRH